MAVIVGEVIVQFLISPVLKKIVYNLYIGELALLMRHLSAGSTGSKLNI